jgi:hypothetical protein
MILGHLGGMSIIFNKKVLSSKFQEVSRPGSFDAGKLETRPFFFLDFKGTAHKAIFSGLRIKEVVLSNQSDLPAFFSL